jgi:hypothetical protein
MAHIRSRLTRLERKQRFLDWLLWQRALDSLTEDECRTYLRDRKFPESIPNRSSAFDIRDQKTLSKLWEEDERISAGRSQEEGEYFRENGHWPDERGRLHFFMEDGKWVVAWRIDPEEHGDGLGTRTEEGK